MFAKIMLIPVVLANSHGGHSGHSSHSTLNTHSSHSTHKSYNPRHKATSVIATYLIFGHFSDGVENLFYVNENYYTFNITYYVKKVDEGTKECIYYIVSENHLRIDKFLREITHEFYNCKNKNIKNCIYQNIKIEKKNNYFQISKEKK